MQKDERFPKTCDGSDYLKFNAMIAQLAKNLLKVLNCEHIH